MLLAGDTSSSTATPRRDGIDVTRILALLVVVMGHLLLAVIDRSGGQVRGDNLLALHPGWAPLAALAPMPMFFAAGGWANATADLRTAAPRLRTLVGLGAVVVAAWSAGVVGTVVVSGGPAIVGDGARIATQPLWFLAAYVPLAAAGRPVARGAARHPIVLIGGILALLAVLDLARFAGDAPELIAWPGFFLAWSVPWMLGAWWRAGHERGGFPERRAGLALALGGGAAAAGLVAFGGYAPALIDAVPGARSNTTPPSLYTAVAAVAQVGLLLAGARALDRIGRRWRALWSRAGEAAVGVYVWHLTALALVTAVVAAGLPLPERLTWWWWATRPLWWASVLAVTAALVAVTSFARGRLRARLAAGVRPIGITRALVGVTATTAGAATVGLRGPRSIPLAFLCAGLFITGWWLLGGRRHAVAAPAEPAAV